MTAPICGRICGPGRYFSLTLVALISACGQANGGGFANGPSGTGGGGAQAGGTVKAGGGNSVVGRGGSVDLEGPGNQGGDDSGDAGVRVAAVWPPAGFINVTDGVVGAYGLGPEITEGGETTAVQTEDESGQCGGLFAVVRDFKMWDRRESDGHPDFESQMASDVGIVLDTLDADRKPVYANADGKTPTTSGADNFNQWFRDVPGVNRSFVLGLHLVANKGVLTFQADDFFPLDDQGFGNESQKHNFAFTTEIHTTFLYNGGETFTFIGDDDVFAFINNHLVIDLGGVHNAKTKKVVLDDLSAQLEIEKGQIYDLAVFHAERHTVESHFRIDSTLTFMDCGQIPAVAR